MSQSFKDTIAKYYFYKYGHIGCKLPIIHNIVFSNETVSIITDSEIDKSKVKPLKYTKLANNKTAYTFKIEKMGLNPVKQQVYYS